LKIKYLKLKKKNEKITIYKVLIKIMMKINLLKRTKFTKRLRKLNRMIKYIIKMKIILMRVKMKGFINKKITILLIKITRRLMRIKMKRKETITSIIMKNKKLKILSLKMSRQLMKIKRLRRTEKK
jgi:hypothetical protein